MNQENKLLQKFLENPISIKYSELKKNLISIGFIKRQGKGSHIHFKSCIHNLRFSIPVHNNKCKNIYKINVYKKIKNILN